MIPLSDRENTPTYLIANPLSGNVSLLSEEELKALTGFPHVHDNDTVSRLKDAGYITQFTQEKEEALMEKRYNTRKKPMDPRAGIIITYQCDLRCTYCWTDFLFDDNQVMNRSIDTKTVDAAFKAIELIPALQSLDRFSFYGGEPFLLSNMDIIKYILDKGSERGYLFHANTNGCSLKKIVPLLAQYNFGGIGVTLDGVSAVHDARRKKADGHGTFHQIVEGVDDALDHGITIGIRINVDGDNISHLPAFADWVREHGWAKREDITFFAATVRRGLYKIPSSLLTHYEVGKKMTELYDAYPSLQGFIHYDWEYMVDGYLSSAVIHGCELAPRPFYCNAYYQGYIFDPFGDMYSCPRAVGDTTFSIGRFVPELKFTKAYEAWFNRDVLSIPRCRECELALLCGGGCAYEAHMECNTLYEGHCERYKAFLAYGLPLFVKWRTLYR